MTMRIEIPFLFAAGVLVLLTALPSCVTPAREKKPVTTDYSRQLSPGEQALVLVRDPAEYPDFTAAFRDTEPLIKAVNASLSFMDKPSSRTHFPVEGITHERARRSLEAFRDDVLRSKSPEEFRKRIARNFDIYRSVGYDRAGTVLFTGYCEPVINACKTRTERFRFPLYRLPEDLVKDPDGTTRGRATAAGVELPYYTRGEIDGEGVLSGRGLELAWLESALDAYIVHVQGSASLRLPDGKVLKVGYAGKNGRPYSSLGQALIAEGKLSRDGVSLDAIRGYFSRNPEEQAGFLYRNESYVFFTDRSGGPFGSIGVEVTPYRTIATDKSVFPRAGVTLFETSLPKRKAGGGTTLEPYAGFALDQDTGGAIRSAGRVDIFMGTGRDAEYLAGRVRSEGRLYYLFTKGPVL